MQQSIRATELTRDQRQLLRDALQEWWDKAIERLNERRQQKQSEWRAKEHDRLGRLESLIQKNDNVVSGLRDQIDDLREKQASARTEEFADLVGGWIREKYEKIADIERTNEEVEQKIREIRSRLAGN
ncbi:MAG: hypothetical protein HY093_04545 [Candidatus Liptonbacteria bacterium]|nr:hypothetical protein [Candidatus Liptonbacteria bacterium]